MTRAPAALLLLAGCHALTPEPPRRCALPTAGFLGWSGYPANIGGGIPVEPLDKNTITVARDGELAWNGAVLDGTVDTPGDATLDLYLAQVARLRPQPITILDFDRSAPCARIGRIRAIMERHLDCSRSRRCFQGRSPLPVVN